MKKNEGETALIEQILDKYRFTVPVPAETRAEILALKRKTLIKVLKTAGAFTALNGIFLFCYFTIKKSGIALAITKAALTVTAAAAVSLGGYHTARYIARIIASPDKTQSSEESVLPNPMEQPQWIDEIHLYNGRILYGTILTRGETYEILSGSNIIRIPRKQIQSIKPGVGFK